MKLRVIMQSEASECSLACMAMVADFHGLRLDLTELRRRFSVSLKGATLSSLLRHARLLGFSARPLQLGLDELPQLKTPCILHWDLNHFVVLTRVTSNRIWIIDPAVGERRLSFDEVSASFTGIAIELRPDVSFTPADTRRTVGWRDLLSPISGLRSAAVQILLLALALEAFALATPLLSQFLIDDVVVTGQLETIWVVAIGFGLLLLIQSLIEWVRVSLVLRMSLEVRGIWAVSVFSHLLSLSPAFFEKRHLGDIVSRFGSLAAIQRTLTTAAITAVLDGVMALLTLAVMLAYSITLTLVVVLSAFAFGLLRWAFFYPMRTATQQRLAISAKENSFFLESIRGIVPLKLAGRQDERAAQWARYFLDALGREYSEQRLANASGVAVHLVAGSTSVLVLALGTNHVIHSLLTVGMLTAFSSYASTFVGRATGLIGYVAELRMLGLHRERLADIALEPAEENACSVEVDLQRLQPTIELRNVSFRYADSEPWVLENVNMRVESGESVVLVGRTGSGKTTLVKIILGILEPTHGDILFDGIPVRQLGLTNYRTQLAAVLQDDSLLAGSLLENISFFAAQPDVARVQLCAHMASIHGEIAAMPMGYQTMVGDMGSSLSGGQKQRVLLARALYLAPRVLVADEATSHLDIATEKIVNDSIRALGITRILVSHRNETIAFADRIIDIGSSLASNNKIPSDNRQPILERQLDAAKAFN